MVSLQIPGFSNFVNFFHIFGTSVLVACFPANRWPTVFFSFNFYHFVHGLWTDGCLHCSDEHTHTAHACQARILLTPTYLAVT